MMYLPRTDCRPRHLEEHRYWGNSGRLNILLWFGAEDVPQSKKIGLLIFSVALLFLSAHAYSVNSAQAEEVRLGKHVLKIPADNLVSSIPFWLRLIPGLAPSHDEILLKMGAREIAEEVPGYQVYEGKLKNDVRLRLEVLDEKNIEQLRNPVSNIYHDIWYGRGPYDNRVVEDHDGSPFYKVYDKKPYIYWSALRVYPDATVPMPDDPFSFWVASCVEHNAPITSTGYSTSCQSQLVHDDLLLDFRINEVNLHLIDAIKSLLVKKILLWKRHD